MDTIRERIIAAIETKAADILTTNGFNSDCGSNVKRADTRFPDSETDAVDIFPGVETAENIHGARVCKMELRLELTKLFTTENPSVVCEQLLGDLLEMVLGTKWTVAFDTGSNEIEVGDTITGKTSGATAFVSGVTVSGGTWAGNDAAGTLALRRVSTTEFQTGETVTVGGVDSVIFTGQPSGTSAVNTTTAGLADAIIYVRGGVEQYPEANNQVAGVLGDFIVQYTTTIDDPYSQQ